MKVLMVTREFPPYVVGGVGTHTLHLSQAVQRAGVDVNVISFGSPKASSGLVRFVHPKSSIISRSAYGTGHDLAIIYDIVRYGKILRSVVAKNDYNIVHVQEPYVGGFLRAENKITTVHDTSYGELRSMATGPSGVREIGKIAFYSTLGFIEEYASLASSKAIITPAPNIRSELVEKYRIGADKVITVMNGASENTFSAISKQEAKRSVNIDPAKALVFTTARHITRKRLDVLLVALSRLNDEGMLNGVEVRIGGDGPLRSYLERLAESLGIASKVHFTGWLSDDQLSLHLRASDIFVVCSEYEASPIAVLEAMISGAAVVCTNIQGFPAPSLAKAGVEILLVPPRHAHALATAIRRLLTDRGLRDGISTNGARFAAQYTWDKVAKRTIGVYEACLAQ
jgi:glycosyltransferase involved in cell wall biosynthesis